MGSEPWTYIYPGIPPYNVKNLQESTDSVLPQVNVTFNIHHTHSLSNLRNGLWDGVKQLRLLLIILNNFGQHVKHSTHHIQCGCFEYSLVALHVIRQEAEHIVANGTGEDPCNLRHISDP